MSYSVIQDHPDFENLFDSIDTILDECLDCPDYENIFNEIEIDNILDNYLDLDGNTLNNINYVNYVNYSKQLTFDEFLKKEEDKFEKEIVDILNKNNNISEKFINREFLIIQMSENTFKIFTGQDKHINYVYKKYSFGKTFDFMKFRLNEDVNTSFVKNKLKNHFLDNYTKGSFSITSNNITINLKKIKKNELYNVINQMFKN